MLVPGTIIGPFQLQLIISFVFWCCMVQVYIIKKFSQQNLQYDSETIIGQRQISVLWAYKSNCIVLKILEGLDEIIENQTRLKSYEFHFDLQHNYTYILFSFQQLFQELLSMAITTPLNRCMNIFWKEQLTIWHTGHLVVSKVCFSHSN